MPVKKAAKSVKRAVPKKAVPKKKAAPKPSAASKKMLTSAVKRASIPVSGHGVVLAGGGWNPFKHAERDFRNVGKAFNAVKHEVTKVIPAENFAKALKAGLEAAPGGPQMAFLAAGKALVGMGIPAGPFTPMVAAPPQNMSQSIRNLNMMSRGITQNFSKKVHKDVLGYGIVPPRPSPGPRRPTGAGVKLAGAGRKVVKRSYL